MVKLSNQQENPHQSRKTEHTDEKNEEPFAGYINRNRSTSDFHLHPKENSPVRN